MKRIIQETCPDFAVPALMPDGQFNVSFRLSGPRAGRYGMIFFYPLDFNYISLTELMSIEKRLADFAALDTELLAVSCDSHLAHQAWRGMPFAEGGLGTIGFPMATDMTRSVAKLFDVLVADAMPEAATVLIDRDNKVIFQCRHDTAVGRNIDCVLEAIRLYEVNDKVPTAPVEQILLLEENAEKFRQLGCRIIAQSADTGLDHPQWAGLPQNDSGKLELSFPLLADRQEWPQHEGLTLAVREGLGFHSTGLFARDGQLLFEHHADRFIPRNFDEILRVVAAAKHHQATGEVVPWEMPGGQN